MITDPFLGIWLLVASVNYTSNLEFIDGRPDPMGVVNWLNNKDNNFIADITPAEGLTLIITEEGFREEKTGEPTIKWFNAMGELSSVQPFQGRLSICRSKIYLIVDDIPHWSKHPSKEGRLKYRYADGDTIISDMLEIRDEKLVRTVNVVTDSMHFDRVIIVYKKVKQ